MCVCALLFRVVHCVGAFSDKYRRDLLKYRIGLIRGRLLGGPKERRRRYLPRLKRAWSRFVAFTWKNLSSSHNFTRERAAPRTAPSTLPSTTPCTIPRTTPRPARSTGSSRAACPTPDTATNLIQLLAGMLPVPTGPVPIRRLSRGRYQLLGGVLVHLPVRLLS